jgi:hypothetical protein
MFLVALQYQTFRRASAAALGTTHLAMAAKNPEVVIGDPEKNAVVMIRKPRSMLVFI